MSPIEEKDPGLRELRSLEDARGDHDGMAMRFRSAIRSVSRNWIRDSKNERNGQRGFLFFLLCLL